MQPAPWSQTQLKRLGRVIRDGGVRPPALPEYDDVMIWYNDLAAEVQRRLAEHDWSPILGSRRYEITSRAKTIDTLRQKLERDKATPLASIQDLAGVRFEAEMSLDEQDLVADQVAHLFNQDRKCIHDLRSDPHSGYRAVHVWLRIEGRVEVQVRTHLQSDWANLYETVADYLGRGIRYGEVPQDPDGADIVSGLQIMSIERIADLEALRNNAASLKAENSKRLARLADFGEDDTLPHELVNAQEADVRLGELQQLGETQERELRSGMEALRIMFESMKRGGA